MMSAGAPAPAEKVSPAHGTGPSSLAIRRPIGTIGVFLVVLVLGLFYLDRLPVDLLPQITYPQVRVTVNYPGVAPEVMEEQVTRVLERNLAATENLVRITGRASEGRTNVDLYFSYSADIDFALQDASRHLERARTQLPPDIDPPRIYKFDPSQIPIYQAGFTSTERSPIEVRDWLENRLTAQLLAVEGVGSVEISGGLIREVDVVVDQERLAAYGLPISAVVDALASANVDIAAGNVTSDSFDVMAKTDGRLADMAAVEAVSIPLPGAGGRISLSEVARVSDGHREQRLFVSMDGSPATQLSVFKLPDANTVQVVDEVTRALELLQASRFIPEDMVWQSTRDPTHFIRGSIRGVATAAVLGGSLAMLLVLAFLGSLRKAFVVGLSIPMAVAATFALMGGFGLTLNVMSLGGLALGVGPLLDNAIVMPEMPAGLWAREAEARLRALEIPGRIRVSPPRIQGLRTNFAGSDVSIGVVGDDLFVLERVGREVMDRLHGIHGLDGVELGREERTPLLSVDVDRERADSVGLTVGEVGRALRSAVDGVVATQYASGGAEYPVRVRLPRSVTGQADTLGAVVLWNGSGVPIRLGDVAQPSLRDGPAHIERENQVRILRINADVNTSLTDVGTVMAEIRERLTAIDMPQGYQLVFGGEEEAIRETNRGLTTVILLAVFLVLVVLAVQYEGLTGPLVILGAVPLALIGVVGALWLTGTPQSAPVLLGVILLVGIVVNNAILLVEWIERGRKRGLEIKESAIEAGALRLRPILMTTSTTVLGMLPLAIGLIDRLVLAAPHRTTLGSQAVASSEDLRPKLLGERLDHIGLIRRSGEASREPASRPHHRTHPRDGSGCSLRSRETESKQAAEAFSSYSLTVAFIWLVGFRNRVTVLADWFWTDITNRRVARIIIPSARPETRALGREK